MNFLSRLAAYIKRTNNSTLAVKILAINAINDSKTRELSAKKLFTAVKKSSKTVVSEMRANTRRGEKVDNDTRKQALKLADLLEKLKDFINEKTYKVTDAIVKEARNYIKSGDPSKLNKARLDSRNEYQGASGLWGSINHAQWALGSPDYWEQPDYLEEGISRIDNVLKSLASNPDRLK